MIKRLKRIVALLVILTLGASAYVAWAGFTDRELIWPLSAVITGQKVVGNDSDYRDLEVPEREGSVFDGEITVENPTAVYQDVWVTVDLFDGEQNVGELSGSVTLKPRSSSIVELSSLDRYVDWTDAYVDLWRLPS